MLLQSKKKKKTAPSKQRVALFGVDLRGAEPAAEHTTVTVCSVLNQCKSGANVMMLAAHQHSLAGVTTTIGR